MKVYKHQPENPLDGIAGTFTRYQCLIVINFMLTMVVSLMVKPRSHKALPGVRFTYDLPGSFLLRLCPLRLSMVTSPAVPDNLNSLRRE